jgi:hypothetical protein
MSINYVENFSLLKIAKTGEVWKFEALYDKFYQ